MGKENIEAIYKPVACCKVKPALEKKTIDIFYSLYKKIAFMAIDLFHNCSRVNLCVRGV